MTAGLAGAPRSAAPRCRTLLQPRDTWLSMTHLPALPGLIQSPSTATASPLHCKERGAHGSSQWGLGAAVGQLATPQCQWALGPSFLWLPPLLKTTLHIHTKSLDISLGSCDSDGVLRRNCVVRLLINKSSNKLKVLSSS